MNVPNDRNDQNDHLNWSSKIACLKNAKVHTTNQFPELSSISFMPAELADHTVILYYIENLQYFCNTLCSTECRLYLFSKKTDTGKLTC